MTTTDLSAPCAPASAAPYAPPSAAPYAPPSAAPADPDPAALADLLARLTGYPDRPSQLRTDDDWRAWDERCRALDAAAQAEHDARRRDQLAGLAPRATGGTWEAHLAWLAREHGRHEFSVSAVRTAALAGTWAEPPGRWDPAAPEFARRLGSAYAGIAHRVTGGMVLAPAGKTGGTRRWAVTVKEDPAV